MSHYDVGIIGYGPVGATLAGLLAKGGLSVLVLEREAAAYHLPRAVHFDDEVMRVFQTLGLADQVEAFTHISPGMRFVDKSGRLLLDWSRPQQVGPQGWNVSYRFHQPDLERILRDSIARNPAVEVRSRADVFAVEERQDRVEIRYEDLSNGRLHAVTAGYVVGCDGARSLVRRLIGSGVEDLGFHERWLVVDLLLKRAMPALGDYSIQHCDPARPSTYVRGTGMRRRWEITLLPDEDSQAMTTPERVWPLLARWIGPDDADLERAACYTFHSVIAERWRQGRMLIAGDAAHQTPPFLGQGMCAGIRDAANLAWKLARVVRSLSPPSLLDSYQTERIPNVRQYIELAVRLGGLINTTAAEAAVPGGLQREQPARMESLKPVLGPGLAAGLDILGGEPAPQPRAADGTRFDDRVGYRPAALLRPAFARSLPPAVVQQCRDRDIAVVDDPPEPLQHWMQAADVGGVIVRPDRYVLGAARTAADMAALAAAI